ncbi:MAG TPA: hypothetical protein VGK92_07765 [Gaiellales bacterium]|jgi:hypothetical protein
MTAVLAWARRRTTARSVALVVALVAASLTLAACGGGSAKQPASETYAQRLADSCTSLRTQIEALGKPSDTPIAKVYPGTVRIGKAFVRKISQLTPPAAGKANATAMVREYGYYFEGLRLAYALLTKRHSQQGFLQTAGAADANLHLALGYARKLGASACSRQPFE